MREFWTENLSIDINSPVFNSLPSSHLYLKSLFFRQSTFQKMCTHWQPHKYIRGCQEFSSDREGPQHDGSEQRKEFWTNSASGSDVTPWPLVFRETIRALFSVFAPHLKNWMGSNFLVLTSRRVKINYFPLAPISEERDSTILSLLRVNFRWYWHPELRERQEMDWLGRC